jgi:hypothetical protein
MSFCPEKGRNERKKPVATDFYTMIAYPICMYTYTIDTIQTCQKNSGCQKKNRST